MPPIPGNILLHEKLKWFDAKKNRTILFFKKILGQAGVDFPVLASVPDTGFDCGGQEFPGIYGDTGADCQVIFVEIIQKNPKTSLG